MIDRAEKKVSSQHVIDKYLDCLCMEYGDYDVAAREFFQRRIERLIHEKAELVGRI